MTTQIRRLSVEPLAVPVAVTVTFQAGCSSTKLAERPAPVRTAAAASVATPSQRPGPAVPAPAAQSTVRTVTLHALDDPKSGFFKRAVYFAFDSFMFHDEDRPAIDAHVKYLSTSRSAKVWVEGHADERGGREHNLALGQKRAQAVLKSLALLGAPSGELEAISFGKEKPADPGHDEAAWARDRRANLDYLAR